jgi:L-alanine-DL-glutamate epimerase-like enolase superfamily enzyme
LELLEQPVAHWDLEGMAQVRSSVDTLIEADEAAYSIHDVMNLIRRGSVDVINIKIGKAGGLLHAKKIAALAEAAGLNYVLGTAFGLAPKIAAKLQLAACSTGAMDAVEFTELLLHESLADAAGSAVFSLPLDADGCMPVPTGPGLGVTLNEDLVERYTVK